MKMSAKERREYLWEARHDLMKLVTRVNNLAALDMVNANKKHRRKTAR